MRKRKTHTGVCRTVERFRSAWLADLARQTETEFQSAFADHGARLAVLPIQISHIGYVGEGIELALIPRDPQSWSWWGEFESDLEVRRRRRLSGKWEDTRTANDVAEWIRSGVQAYLSKLKPSQA
jgi:hypothetical protein